MLRSATIIDTPTRHLLRVNPQALDLGTSLPLVVGGQNAREARLPAHFHKHRSSAQPHKQQHARGELIASTRTTRIHHLCHSLPLQRCSLARPAGACAAACAHSTHLRWTCSTCACLRHSCTRACEPGRLGSQYSKIQHVNLLESGTRPVPCRMSSHSEARRDPISTFGIIHTSRYRV